MKQLSLNRLYTINEIQLILESMVGENPKERRVLVETDDEFVPYFMTGDELYTIATIATKSKYNYISFQSSEGIKPKINFHEGGL